MEIADSFVVPSMRARRAGRGREETSEQRVDLPPVHHHPVKPSTWIHEHAAVETVSREKMKIGFPGEFRGR
jgi:hypothetical protein